MSRFSPGQLIRIKEFKKILPKLDSRDQQDGVFFSPYMKKFCGKTARVLTVLTRDGRTPRYFLRGVSSHGTHWVWLEDWLELPDKRPRRKHARSRTNG